MRTLVPAFTVMILAAAVALADPYGPRHAVTDMAPFCASCHASTSLDQMSELPPDAALGETIEHKHLHRIRTDPAYQDLSPEDRETLLDAVAWVDQSASVTIAAPKQARRNSRLDVTVVTTGGAGPVVGLSLVDSTLRFQARTITAGGFKVIGPALVIGPNGKPQTWWTEQRSRGADMGLATVMIDGIQGDALSGRVDETRTTWALRVPPEPGAYTIAAAFFYGTEKAHPLGLLALDGQTTSSGRTNGAGGRIMFSRPMTITVQ